MVFEGEATRRGQNLRATVEVAHEVTFAVAADAIAQDEVVHATAHVDRVDLDVPVVRQGGGQVRRGLIQQQRAPHEAAGAVGIEAKRVHEGDLGIKFVPLELANKKAAPGGCGLRREISPDYFAGVAAWISARRLSRTFISLTRRSSTFFRSVLLTMLRL